VKGILRSDDAAKAVQAGADGVVVSNHGGRQVDRAIPALEALPDVNSRIGDDTTILFDSGIRRGSDAIVALALGADAVLLGRPYVYGLALDGADGVRAVCRNFMADFDLTMGLAGQQSVADIDRSLLRKAGE
jgi:isopentenyl-diphosphate delta-isomerase